MRGRPGRLESERRTRLMVALVASGAGLREAARQAGVAPSRALGLLDDPVFFDAVAAMRRAA